jgi:hypothetical protein
MLPVKDFVVVADSGLMNSRNIAMMESGGYKYIVGARIKNENETIQNRCEVAMHHRSSPLGFCKIYSIKKIRMF